MVIEGGFDQATWLKSNNTPSTLHRDATNPDLTNKTLIGLKADGNSYFRLQDLTITMDDAANDEISLYAIHLTNCSDYNIVRCDIQSGKAGDGIAGSPGSAGTAGVSGTDGGTGSVGTGGTPGTGGSGAATGGGLSGVVVSQID